MNGKSSEAYFGGGCFWCTEAAFEIKEGVLDVVSGYAGGDLENPDYRQVCGGDTGHAEVVKIVYDPDQVSYRSLLEWFFRIHDPTTPNRQGADMGTQYRSIILYQTGEEKVEALRLIDELNRKGLYDSVIVTEVLPLERFWSAEDYHQDYFRRNPGAGYCQAVIAPKMRKLAGEAVPKKQ